MTKRDAIFEGESTLNAAKKRAATLSPRAASLANDTIKGMTCAFVSLSCARRALDRREYLRTLNFGYGEVCGIAYVDSNATIS